MMDVPILPTVNASLNGLSAILLFCGWRAIKAKNTLLHRKCMTAAMISSALFLTTYITYHIMIKGTTHYAKEGISRTIYFIILGTHTPLATLMVPFILAAFYYAFKGDYVRHVRLTKKVWPVWMYVSVTGVVIYLMLYILPW
jgi:putative membrane protein